MRGNCLLIDLLAKSIFSKVISSINFKISLSEKSGLEWNNWSLKFMISSAFFWRIMSLLTALMFWAQKIQEYVRGSQILRSRYFLRFPY